MPILSNSRHERFAQEVAKGSSAKSAYEAAGYTATGAAIGINAGRLLKKAIVRARVDELLAAGAARAEVTVESVVRGLAAIGFSDIRKLVNWRGLVSEVGEDEYGVPITRTVNEVGLIGSHEIDDETAAAISEISQTKDGALKVKMYDKQAALVSLGRHLGMFKDNVNVSGNVSVDDLRAAADSLDDEVARLAAAAGAPQVH